ncbi:MAG TPA: hypothetical protein VNJ52_03785 [Patescibacteria group bacterium]|nr:hypothetical protein [Patescibacteria group bacterium]
MEVRPSYSAGAGSSETSRAQGNGQVVDWIVRGRKRLRPADARLAGDIGNLDLAQWTPRLGGWRSQIVWRDTQREEITLRFGKSIAGECTPARR